MLIVQLPFFVAWGSLFFVPESLQWLMAKNRTKVKNILTRIDYLNNTNMPHICQLVIEDSIGNNERNERNSAGTHHNLSLNLFNSFKMAKESIIIGYAWLTLNIVNYAVLLGSENLGLTSMYINFVCIALVDIPAVLIDYNTLDRIGRKKGTIFSSLICIFALAALTWVRGHSKSMSP